MIMCRGRERTAANAFPSDAFRTFVLRPIRHVQNELEPLMSGSRPPETPVEIIGRASQRTLGYETTAVLAEQWVEVGRTIVRITQRLYTAIHQQASHSCCGIRTALVTAGARGPELTVGCIMHVVRSQIDLKCCVPPCGLLVCFAITMNANEICLSALAMNCEVTCRCPSCRACRPIMAP